jgi:hypothetical protein
MKSTKTIHTSKEKRKDFTKEKKRKKKKKILRNKQTNKKNPELMICQLTAFQK